ncbi:MAG: nucleoside-specific outer membrane channel protein Tsx [Marivirga sp.]|jgi:nucleoside-specific outer membrane channel protein Tsx
MSYCRNYYFTILSVMGIFKDYISPQTWWCIQIKLKAKAKRDFFDMYRFCIGQFLLKTEELNTQNVFC